jgi:hypothetical protein
VRAGSSNRGRKPSPSTRASSAGPPPRSGACPEGAAPSADALSVSAGLSEPGTRRDCPSQTVLALGLACPRWSRPLAGSSPRQLRTREARSFARARDRTVSVSHKVTHCVSLTECKGTLTRARVVTHLTTAHLTARQTCRPCRVRLHREAFAAPSGRGAAATGVSGIVQGRRFVSRSPFARGVGRSASSMAAGGGVSSQPSRVARVRQ